MTIERYYKYFQIGEHILITGIGLASINILFNEGFNGVNTSLFFSFSS